MPQESQFEQQEQFQKAQDDIEYLNFNKSEHIDRLIDSRRQSRRMSIKESVGLRLQKITNHQITKNNGKSHNNNHQKNISFEVQLFFIICQSQPQNYPHDNSLSYNPDIDESGISSLGYYYENHSHAQLVYRKARNLGTSWIGQKEFYTSLFATPDMIEKNKGTSLFGTEKSQEHTSQHIGSNFHLYTKATNPQTQMHFDSQFQSGNLFAVYKVGILEYDLLLQNDINTKGNTQWFYFRITNPPANKSIKLNIVNFRKPDSLFNYGMLPCFYSLQNEKKSSQNWIRRGEAVKYFRNNHIVEGSTHKYYYTLTFTISTEHTNDVMKIAQSYPYTYTDLHNWFDDLFRVNYRKNFCHKVNVMPKTLGGNKIDSLLIKENNLTKFKLNDPRPLILVFARQHPGESPGSFMMEGLVEYFLSKDKDSEFLRKNYQIRAIPMTNPDGVQAGNYRTNLYGVDLNRNWDCSTKQKTTATKDSQINQQAIQIIYIKRYIATYTKGRQIAYIVDFHGHSRKLNSFFYGNLFPQSPSDVKMFPFVCSKLTSMIKYDDCTFSLEDDKRATARVQLFSTLKSPNIYTFEASFFGYIGKNKQKKHFTIESYKNLGMIIGKAMYICEKRKEISTQGMEIKEKFLYDKWWKELMSSYLITVGEKEDSGSESCPQECQIRQIEKKILQEQFAAYQQEQSLKKPTTATKKARQKFRHQNLTSAKQTLKTLRQMQVLEIARVNSIFPHDVLALVPNNFYMKMSSTAMKVKNDMKNSEIQTDPCPLISIYGVCKYGEQTDDGIQKSYLIQTNPNNHINQNKSQLITRPKPKVSPSPIFQSSQKIDKSSSLIQQALKNLSTLSITRSKSIHQKQLYQNARHLNALKKSTDIRKNFKKVFTQYQLGRLKGDVGRNPSEPSDKEKIKTDKIIQTVISFCGKKIVKQNLLIVEDNQQLLTSFQSIQQTPKKHQYQSKNSSKQISKKMFPQSPQKKQTPIKQKITENQQKYWTIEAKHRSLGIQVKEFNTPLPRNQFRKTTIFTKNIFRSDSRNNYETERVDKKNQKMMDNWRIKKKSLI